MRHPAALKSIGLRVCLAAALFSSSLVMVAPDAVSGEPDHTIRLHHLHTGEKGEFTYKRNGRYDKAELAKINRLLRDWRKDQVITIDPHVLDLIWAVYRETGGTGYIDIVCGYRSPATNSMLRSRSRGVAQKSQHMLGKAIDFYIPGVPLAKLRAAAMKIQGGGVGYYPTSGSPFVHMDTGNVRAWPRMTRQQLVALFPDGNTLHLPADGKPLPGYEKALARRKSGGETALAYLDAGDTRGKSSGNWLKRVFSGGADQAEDDEASGTSTATVEPPAAIAAAPARAIAPAPPTAPVEQAAPVQQPAPVEQAAPALPAAAPAVGDPEVLIAAQDAAADPRVPRPRPPTEAEIVVASNALEAPAPEPESAVADDDASALDALAYAPLPRTRPDAGLLATSLSGAPGAPESLDIAAADALAALSAEQTPAQAASPEPQSAQLAIAALESAATPPPPAVSSPAAHRAPSLALAFAGSDLPMADIPVPSPAPQLARKGDRMKVRAAAAKDTPEAPPAGLVYDPDQARLRELLTEPQPDPAPVIASAVLTPANREFTGFAMPQPSGARSLYAAPETARDVASTSDLPALSAGRLQIAMNEPARQDGGFLSRLFASLSE